MVDTRPITFDIRMGDNVFTPNAFILPPGQDIRFIITNDGEERHNMRIAGADNMYTTDQDVFTPAIEPGEIGRLRWTTPEEPGDYVFQCDYHPVEQVGIIRVEDSTADG